MSLDPDAAAYDERPPVPRAKPLPEGSVIGVLGNGQLGRMFTQAAHDLGYKVWVFGPGRGSPAGQVADREFDAAYDDAGALAVFSAGIRAATFEFENIPRATLDALAAKVPTHPSPEVLYITQNRLREKTWLRDNGFPVPEFVLVRSAAELPDAVDFIGAPCVLKTASFGYDGKGQTLIHEGADLDAAWDALGAPEAVLEAFVDFERELSVVCARNALGQTRCFPVCHNEHHRHILAVTRAPAALDSSLTFRAQAFAAQAAQALRVTGLLTSELFLTRTGEILFNELAPRPHNSGHFSIDACSSSQFRHHVLAITGHPLPIVTQRHPAIMANLLGDLWADGEPDFDGMRALPGAALHLYGKADAKPRRKMGHLTVTGPELAEIEPLLVQLGRDQTFERPAPPSPAAILEGRLRADPFAPFVLTLASGQTLAIDHPRALARLRDRFVFEQPGGSLLTFDPADVQSVA